MRLKIENLNKAIKDLTGGELSLYIYITQRSDRNGLLQDLMMKEVCLKTNLSKQHFYNCLYALEEKGFLYVSQTKSVGYDILLIDNKFLSEEDSSEPYLNLHYSFLNTLAFHKLPVAIKRFLLRALSFAGKHKWTVSEDTLKSPEAESFAMLRRMSISMDGPSSAASTLKIHTAISCLRQAILAPSSRPVVRGYG